MFTKWELYENVPCRIVNNMQSNTYETLTVRKMGTKKRMNRNEIVRTQTIHMLNVFSWTLFVCLACCPALQSVLVYGTMLDILFIIYRAHRVQQTKWGEQFYGRKAIEIKEKNWKTTVCRYCILFDAIHSICSIMCDIWRSVFIIVCVCVYICLAFPVPFYSLSYTHFSLSLSHSMLTYWNEQITQTTHQSLGSVIDFSVHLMRCIVHEYENCT